MRLLLERRSLSLARMALTTAVACLAVGLLGAGSAHAAFGLAALDGAVSNADGSAFTQAGGHPASASVTFDLNRVTKPDGLIAPDGGDLKDIAVELPPGLIGNPTAMPRCQSLAGVLEFADPNKSCPISSIVGTANVSLGFPGSVETYVSPVFGMEPPPGVAAEFAFAPVSLGVPVVLEATVRTEGDSGVTVKVRNAPQTSTALGSSVTLWGTPADPSHDIERCLVHPIPLEFFPLPLCIGDPNTVAGPNPAGVPEHAFLTNPTRCTPAGAGLETRVRAVSWDPTSAPVEGSFVSHLPPGYPLAPEDWGAPQGPTGCDDVPFEPSIEVRADTRRPDSPTGLDIDIAFPQDGLVNPLGIATAHLDRAQVTLPDGMTISPASADGLAACSDDQFGIDSRDPVSCPAASKIGTVEAETPLLEERLTGGLYVGEQRSQDPESGEMFRLFMTLESPQRGIRVKLAGRVRADAETGRLETVFDDNPQLPVTKISLRIKGGPRAPLATPPTCGVKTVTSELTAWSGASATPSDSFTVDCPGQQGFSPSFEAGSTVAVGGAFSPFLARIGRPDGQQFLSGVQVDTPKGLVAKLRGVPLCGSVAAANGGCPEGSRIGTATVGAGAGSNPFYLSGPVYLTTGYKGAPYGLSTQVPVKAGPFDLGTVVVRQAIHIDPETAELSVVSDPLPQIVGGVPARLRSVEVDVDRAGFTVNPTSCAEKRIDATLTSIGGAVHRTSSRFQVGDCQSLGFEPRLAMRLVGRKQRRTGGHPSLRVSLRQPSGQANLNRLRVALPRTLALDPGNANGLCSYEEGLKHDPKCPASSIVGRATAFTPVLNEPLTGPVYFVENKRRTAQGNLVRTLPTLVIPLRGEVAINVRQRSSVSGGRLVSTTTGIPDAPVSRFDLRLNGGRGGILTVTRNARRRFDLCKGRQLARVLSRGQNGKRADFGVVVRSPCRRH